MCIITLENQQGHVDITKTKIFARHTSNDYQLIVYSMSIQTDTSAAMILPIPVKPDSGEDAVRFINIPHHRPPSSADIILKNEYGEMPEFIMPAIDHTKTTNFFTMLEEVCHTEYQAPIDNEAFFSLQPMSAEASLKVHDIGDYHASYIPTKADFNRLDPQFQLKTELWDKLPDYNDYGFVVFKLKTSVDPETQSDIPPMAFEFPTAYPYRLFFPTIHVHGSDEHEDLSQADFDHILYCQREHARAEFKYQRDLLKQVTPTPVQKIIKIYRSSDNSRDSEDNYPFRGYAWFSRSVNASTSIANIAEDYQGIVDPNKAIFAMTLQGKYKNQDIFLGKKLATSSPTIQDDANQPCKTHKAPILVLSTDDIVPDLMFIGKEQGDSISIGRDINNTWVLPDKNKYLSKNHAFILYIDEEYILLDSSVNGIFVNYHKKKIGYGNKVKLRHGDVLYMGKCIIRVGLINGDNKVRSLHQNDDLSHDIDNPHTKK